MDTVFIDGSKGEGGGQILRTSLTLSCITGRSLHIENIRAARRNPGLANQHLICVRAACQICNGQAQGATKGSRILDFQPGPVRSGDYHFDIGSAGSASLVIQTLLPALFLADKTSTVTVTGGTHNPMAPPFDFLDETFLPAIATAGFQGDCKLIKHGFYPAGGGKITFNIQPWQKNKGKIIDLCHTNTELQIHGRIFTAKLPEHVAQRQSKLLLQSDLKIHNVEHIDVKESDGPGNCAMIRICSCERTTVFTAFGKRGKSSEQVISEVTSLAEKILASDTAVDRFLADQLLIYMALTKAGSFTTNELSSHLQTNMEVIKKFLSVDFNVEHQEQAYRIICLSP
ncbi:MAG: RNA 3'-terminal phosphate cyclase [Phycisphaerae bacterium]|nr:RNA 3'-terminal phosphate cyclase [Phycisphaerae bacterium]